MKPGRPPMKSQPREGFACPDCGKRSARVIDTRYRNQRIRRRRVCPEGHRYTTFELTWSDVLALEESQHAYRKWQMSLREMVEPAA